MTIIQRFEKQKRIIFVMWDGSVTAKQWFQYAERLVSHPTWKSTPRLLADLRSVEDTSTIGNEAMDHAVNIFTAERAGLTGKKIAVIAGDAFGKASRFGGLLSSYGVSLVVFNVLETACVYLGVDVTYANQVLDDMREQL